MINYSALYVGNTSIIELDGLADQDGAYQNDAAVTLQSLVDKRTGDAVSGVTVPLTLSYVASSNGKYQGTIPHDADVTAGRVYIATILAISSAGQKAEWTEGVVAQGRQGRCRGLRWAARR